MLFKDQILNQLTNKANVAQFVSFSPRLEQRYSRVFSYEKNHKFESKEQAIKELLKKSGEKSVNIRSFDPSDPKSKDFIYGLNTVDGCLYSLLNLSSKGLHTIIGETIDIRDGGVSGVIMGDTIEFSPEDTPRCVEKSGVLSMPRQLGLRILKTIYGFNPNLECYPSNLRVEFSIHPLRRGINNDHTIIWEIEDIGYSPVYNPKIRWPNNFSRFIGDKAFGLLVASLIGLPVAETLVIPRKLSPFSFGKPTGSCEKWIRTCPFEPVPGKFTTKHGWCDPYQLMSLEDPMGTQISSVIVQDSIDATYSGALLTTDTGDTIIEGVSGFGDDFMTGNKTPESLPEELILSIRGLYQQLFGIFGPVRMEWVADNNQVWIAQLHIGQVNSTGRTIFPGNASFYHRFDVGKGLELLRELINTIGNNGEGIVLVGNVGLTSHFGDVLRRSRIPSYLEDLC